MNMTHFDEIKELLEGQGDALKGFKAASDERIATLEREVREVLKKANRPPPGGSSFEADAGESGSQSGWFDAKAKTPVTVLERKDSFASVVKSDGRIRGLPMAPSPTFGRLMRGIVLGGRADDADELAEERKSLGISSDPSGGYTVSGQLAASWIDALRAKMALVQAGAVTVPMDSKTLTIARVLSDPTCHWHAENASLQDGDPTFGAVTLHAKTVVCLVRFSLELAQDSANIENVLSSTLTNAMANAIDAAGLVGVTEDAGGAPSGIMNLPSRNSVSGIGAPANWDFLVDGMYELMADNVPMERIGSFVAHPAVWKKMAKLKTGISGDGTSLVPPAEVTALPKIWTTAAPLESSTASGIIADWNDLIFGVRKDITVRVLDQAFMGSNLQLAVLAYARCDFVPARAGSFCTLEGITV